MARGKIRTEFWWDTKLSNGKTPKQIVRLLGKDLLLIEKDVEQILTRLLVLQDKKFFKTGVNTTTRILVSMYLCCSSWMLGKDPISPRKFSRNCEKNGFDVSYSLLMKHVRGAKLAGFFGRAPSCEEIIAKYRRRMGFKFKIDDETLNRIHLLAGDPDIKKKTAGRSPLVVAASLTYVCTQKERLDVTQKQLSRFFGITEVGLRKFLGDNRDYLN